MSPFTFVLGIIAIVVVGRLIRENMRLKASRPADEPEQRARLDALEERVRTLEKIVTDEAYDLKREFNKL